MRTKRLNSSGAADRMKALQQGFRKTGVGLPPRKLAFRWSAAASATAFLVAVLMIICGAYVYDLSRYAKKFGSWDLAWRHVQASPNCAAARRVELDNARRGEPGYFASHDADNDGIACEPYKT